MALPNIFSLFQPASPSANQNVLVPSAATPAAIAGQTPAAIPPAGEGDKSPLSGFKELWKNDPNAPENKPTPPMFANDPTKLLEAARTIDFAKVMPPEVVAKIIAGGEGAAAAFNQAINAVSQQAYAQSAHATTKIVEAALEKQQELLMAKIPDLVRKHAVKDALRTDNPLYSNPAAAPILEMFEAQITKQNPTATAEQIKGMSNQFLNEFADLIRKGQTPAGQTNLDGSMKKAGTKDDDWSSFFGEPVS